MFYGLYKLFSQLVPFLDKPLFEPVVKLGFALVTLLVGYASTQSIRRILAAQEVQVSAPVIFLVLVGVMLSASYHASLQIEWISTLLVLAAIPLAASERIPLNWLAGLVLAILFPLKGITLLMAGYVFIALHSSGKPYRKRLIHAAAATAASVVVVAIGIVNFFPGEVADLRFATQIQHSFVAAGFSADSRRMALYSFLRDTLHLSEPLARVPVAIAGELLDRSRALLTGLVLNAIPNIPFLAAGAISVALLTTWATRGRKPSVAVPSLVMWAIGLAIVEVQAHYFPYHYFVLAFPAAWSFLTFIGHRSEILVAVVGARGLRIVLMLAFGLVAAAIGYPLWSAGVSFVVLWTIGLIAIALMLGLPFAPGIGPGSIAGGGAVVLSMLVWTYFVSPVSDHYRTWREFRASEYQGFSELDKKYSLSTQSSIVFLDDGRAAYYLPARSYERYFYGVPLTRGDDVVVRESPIYRGILSRLLSYHETYILIWADDLKLDSFKEIRSKIQAEFTLVETRVWVQQHNFPVGKLWTRRQELLLYQRSTSLNGVGGAR